MATSQAVLLAPRLAALVSLVANGVGRPNIPALIWNTPALYFANGYNNDGTDAIDAITARGIPPVLFWPFGCVFTPEPFWPCGRYAQGWCDLYKNRLGPDRGGEEAYCQVLSQGDLERTVAGGAAYVDRLVAAMATRYTSTDGVLGKRYVYAGVPPIDAPTDATAIAREIDACQRLNAVRICDLEGVLSPLKADGSPTLHYLSRLREWELGRSIGSEVAHRELPETLAWRRNSAAVMHLVSFWDQANLAYPESWLTIRELVEAGIRPMAIILNSGPDPAQRAQRRTDALRMAGLGITPVVDVSSTPISEQEELRDAVAAAGNVWANAAASAWLGTTTRGTPMRQRVRAEDTIAIPDAGKRPSTADHRMPVHTSGTRAGLIVDPWADNPDGDTKAIHVDSARPDNSGNGFSRATAKKTVAGAGGGLSALSSTRIRLRCYNVNETNAAGVIWPASADGTGPNDIAGIVLTGSCALRTATRLTVSGLTDAAVLSFFNNDYRWLAIFGDGTLTLSQPGPWTTNGQGGIGIAVSQATLDNFAAQGVLFDGIKDPVVANPEIDNSAPYTALDAVEVSGSGQSRPVTFSEERHAPRARRGGSLLAADFSGVNASAVTSEMAANVAFWSAPLTYGNPRIFHSEELRQPIIASITAGNAVRWNVLATGSVPTDAALDAMFTRAHQASTAIKADGSWVSGGLFGQAGWDRLIYGLESAHLDAPWRVGGGNPTRWTAWQTIFNRFNLRPSGGPDVPFHQSCDQVVIDNDANLIEFTGVSGAAVYSADWRAYLRDVWQPRLRAKIDLVKSQWLTPFGAGSKPIVVRVRPHESGLIGTRPSEVPEGTCRAGVALPIGMIEQMAIEIRKLGAIPMLWASGQYDRRGGTTYQWASSNPADYRDLSIEDVDFTFCGLRSSPGTTWSSSPTFAEMRGQLQTALNAEITAINASPPGPISAGWVPLPLIEIVAGATERDFIIRVAGARNAPRDWSLLIPRFTCSDGVGTLVPLSETLDAPQSTDQWSAWKLQGAVNEVTPERTTRAIRAGNVAYRNCANIRPVSRNVSPINDNTAGGISQFGADSITIEGCVFGPTATLADAGTRTNHALCYANDYAASFVVNNIVHAGGIDGFTARQGGRVGYNLVLNSSMGIGSGSVPSSFADTLPNTLISRNLISGSKYRSAAFDGEAAAEPGLPPLGRGIVVAKATIVTVAQNIIINADPDTVRDAYAVVVNLLKGRLDVTGNQVDRWARTSNPSGEYPALVYEENTVDVASRQIVLTGNTVSTTLQFTILRTLRPDFPVLTASGNVYQTPAMVTNVAVAGVGTRIEWTSAQWATNTGETVVLVAANPRAGVGDWAQANNIAPSEAAVFDAAIAGMAANAATFQAVDVIDWVAGQRGMWDAPGSAQERFSPAWQRRGVGVRPDGRRYSRAWARRGFGRRMGGA
jgi:hypothetical protein